MSEKRMVYAEDVIQRIRDLAPEILGGNRKWNGFTLTARFYLVSCKPWVR